MLKSHVYKKAVPFYSKKFLATLLQSYDDAKKFSFPYFTKTVNKVQCSMKK